MYFYQLKAAILLIFSLLCCGSATAQRSEWTLIERPIIFKRTSSALSIAAKQRLDTLAMRMNANPDFRLVLEGNGGTLNISIQRVLAVIRYLVDEKEIDYQRFICKPNGSAFDNQVFYRHPFGYEEWPSCYKPATNRSTGK